MKGGAEGRADSIDPYQSDFAVPAFPSMGSHRSNKGLYIAAGLAALALFMLGGGVLAYIVMERDAPAPVPIAISANAQAAAASPEAAAKHAEQLREAESAAQAAVEGKKPPAEDPAANAAAPEAKPSEAVTGNTPKASGTSAPKKKTASKRTSRRKPSSSKREASDDIALVAPAPKKPRKTSRSKRSGGDGIDDLLSDIDKPKQKKKPKTTRQSKPSSNTTASSDLKKSLSKSDVKGTIKRSHSRVRNCFKNNNREGLSGTLKVKFSIEPTGKVRSPRTITSKFRGSDLASCVERVVGKMKFPATQAKKPSVITYPFILR
jgi:outer membrane biosynthesis protein TonB